MAQIQSQAANEQHFASLNSQIQLAEIQSGNIANQLTTQIQMGAQQLGAMTQIADLQARTVMSTNQTTADVQKSMLNVQANRDALQAGVAVQQILNNTVVQQSGQMYAYHTANAQAKASSKASSSAATANIVGSVLGAFF